MKYRMYIDEVGNSDLGASANPNHCYLSLTGVVFDLEYVNDVVVPAVEGLKRQYFESHADEPIILHRKELVNKKHPFEALRDPDVEAAFNQDLLKLLRDLDLVVIAAIIDKLEHNQRYTVWKHDPYHYCQEVIIERYVRWLDRRRAVGDALAESRGKREDGLLKDAYTRIYEQGSDYVRPQMMQARLTSKELKVRPKGNNIAGLQIADLIAHPCFAAARDARNGDPPPATFGAQIAQIVESSKCDRSSSGRVEGWGRKWLP